MEVGVDPAVHPHDARELDRQPANDVEEKTQEDLAALIGCYQLSKGELNNRVRDALKNMERSDIGTIHSFAANLLRLYPLEAGVDLGVADGAVALDRDLQLVAPRRPEHDADVQAIAGDRGELARGGGWVAVSYFGEGASSKGDFHESLNFAAIQKLPLVVVVENNCFA